MLFFAVLQFLVVFLMIALILCQNSEDTVSNFTSGHGGSFSPKGRSSFLVKLTWICVIIFFLNTILLGKFYAEKKISIIDKADEDKFAQILDHSQNMPGSPQ